MILGWLIFLIGSVTLLLTLYTFAWAIRSKSWSKVPAEVLHNAVRRDFGPLICFYVALRYRYTWNGRCCEGDRIRFGSRTFMDEAKAREFAARFPVGSSIEVFCDPRNPKRSVIYPGAQDELLLPLVVAPIFLLVGAGLLWWR